MRNLRAILGGLYPEQGCVSPEKHKEAVHLLPQARKQVLAEFLGVASS